MDEERNGDRMRNPASISRDFHGPLALSQFGDATGRSDGLAHFLPAPGNLPATSLPSDGRCGWLLGSRPAQIGLDEWIDLAVQHRLGVAHLEAGAVVLDHRVGMQDV